MAFEKDESPVTVTLDGEMFTLTNSLKHLHFADNAVWREAGLASAF